MPAKGIGERWSWARDPGRSGPDTWVGERREEGDGRGVSKKWGKGWGGVEVRTEGWSWGGGGNGI